MGSHTIRIRRRHSGLYCLLATLTVFLASGRSMPGHTTLPSGFSEQVIASGFTLPVAFARLSDGRMLVAEKRGLVRLVKNGVLQPTPFIDLRSRVNDYWDRGLVGLAVDPGFAANGRVYLYYVFENNAADYTGPKTSRLTRVTAVGDTASPASEVVLVGTLGGAGCTALPAGADCIPADSPSHNGGGIHAAADGTIYLSTGDGSDFQIVDARALRVQNLDSLSGKLLRVTNAGAGVSTNPFWTGNPGANRSKVVAYGFRNPFRFTVRPTNGTLYVGDVGWDTWEEINVVIPGGNYGWPCYEGASAQAGYASLPTCQALYAQGAAAVVPPLFSEAHNGLSASIVAGAFAEDGHYPGAYDGALFFADYARGRISYLRVNASDALVGSAVVFAPNAGGPVDFHLGPGGDLYYLDIIAGELRGVSYSAGGTSTQYLSDVSWNVVANGWGVPERDRSNGEQGPSDGSPLTLNGQVYAKGIGAHAPSDIRFALSGNCTSFSSRLGVDDEVGRLGSVVFQVWSDGEKLYDSGVVTGDTSTLQVAVNVAGRAELRLVVTDGGDGVNYDHADWADAQLECDAGTGALFAPAVSYAAGTNAHSVAMADLDLDGRLDLVAANAGSSTASVWRGTGTGTFGPRSNFPTGQTPKQITIGDLNGDGIPDLVSANQDAGTISVLIGVGDATFLAPVGYAACAGTHESALGDFNRDGVPDLIVACWGGDVVSVLIGAGNGTFRPAVAYVSGSHPHSVVARDFNGDGILDAAIANHGSADVSVLRGIGDGRFGPAVRYPVGTGPHSIRAGDLDGDGILDLAAVNDGSDTVTVLRGVGNGTFASAVHLPTGDTPKGVALADVNGDGRLDILTANTAGSYPTCCQPGGNTISVLLGTGGGLFGPMKTYVVGLTPFAVGVGDLDGDGDLDVAAANWHSNDVSVLLNLSSVLGPSAPVITGITATGLTTTGATIGWTTDVPADGQVEYGVTASYGTTTPLQPALVTAHQVTLTGLTPNTLYHYRVRSAAGGPASLSPDRTFTTSAASTGSVRYLSDLAWTSMTNGWGPVERDRSNGEVASGDGAPLRVDGVVYAKGLGAHALSDVRYTIPAGCTEFRATVGLDDEVGNNGTVTFEVWGDATRLFQSPTLLGTSAGLGVVVNVSGRSVLRLVVGNGGDNVNYDHADWANARLLCNLPPTPVIAAPEATRPYRVGDQITFAGAASDPEDGALGGSSLAWNVILHHCPSDCHEHPFTNATGATGSFTIPDHGDNNFFTIVLVATDSAGLTASTLVVIHPHTVQLTLDTLPSGLQVTYGGVSGVTPMVVNPVVGSTHTIFAPSPQGTRVFASWSDGGAVQHNIVIGTSAASYVATFTEEPPDGP